MRLGLETLVFLDADDAFLTDLVHGLGDHAADALVAVRAHGTDLCDLLGVCDGVGHSSPRLGHDGVDSLVDAALEAHQAVARW